MVPVLTGKAEVPEAVTRYFVTQYVRRGSGTWARWPRATTSRWVRITHRR